jgi:hypothetical protein
VWSRGVLADGGCCSDSLGLFALLPSFDRLRMGLGRSRPHGIDVGMHASNVGAGGSWQVSLNAFDTHDARLSPRLACEYSRSAGSQTNHVEQNG